MRKVDSLGRHNRAAGFQPVRLAGAPRGAAPRRALPQGRGLGTRGMNGDQTDTYGVPIRPGDVISSRRARSDCRESIGRLGLTLYSYNE